MKVYRALPLLALVLMLGACATPEQRMQVPEPRLATHPQPVMVEEQDSAETDTEASGAQEMQRLESLRRSPAQQSVEDWSSRFPATNTIAVAAEDLPLRDFIHYVFGELLGVSYVLADGLPNLDRTVTLNLQEEVSSRRLYRLALELLEARGAGLTLRDGVFYVHPQDRRGRGGVFMGFGNRPRDVPDVPGPVLQIIPIEHGVTASLERTLRDLLEARISADVPQGAIYVTGERREILQALDVISMLDQPALRARHVGLVRLTFVGMDEFINQVVQLLQTEGVPAGQPPGERQSVVLVPLEQLGGVAVFAIEPRFLDRVEFWRRQIDRPSEGSEERYFLYHPRYARAADIGESLALLLGAPAAADAPRDTRSALGAAEDGLGAARGAVSAAQAPRRDSLGVLPARPAVRVSSEGLTMTADERSNALIFLTTGARYQSLLPMIRRLDVPPRQVLLEATIAEVSLTDEFAMGVEFALNRGRSTLSTEGNLGFPDGGVFFSFLDGGDRVRAQLSASNRLVNILSNPSLVVRDGTAASISVGDDIPTIGATFFDPITSDRQITTVQYRKTGVNLAVRPTVNAQGLVVLEIQQSISNTVEGTSGVEGAPAIFERTVNTEVIARSGQTVVIGGLISEVRSNTASRVPGISQLPVLGRLFRSDRDTATQTELVVLITARIIDDLSQWEDIRERLQRSLKRLDLGPADYQEP